MKKIKRISRPVVFYGRVESIGKSKQFKRKIKGPFWIDGEWKDYQIATYRYEGIISEWSGGPPVTKNAGETILEARRKTNERFKNLLKKLSARRNYKIKWEISDYEIAEKP